MSSTPSPPPPVSMVASWDSHSLFIGRDYKPGSLAASQQCQQAVWSTCIQHENKDAHHLAKACHYSRLSHLDRAIYTSWMWNGKLEETKIYYILLYCTIKQMKSDAFRKGNFFGFLKYFIRHCFVCRPSDTLCRRMQGSNPVLLRLWHWQSDTLNPWLDLILDL